MRRSGKVRGLRVFSRAKLWVLRSALSIVALLASLLLAEGLIRAFLPQQLILIRRDIWQPHEGLGWTRAPGLDTRVNTGEGEVRLATDEEGHRVAPGPQPTAGDGRVLALGDSFVAALQVDYEESLAGLLEVAASQRLGKRVVIDNAAVAGYGPSHYLIQARERLGRIDYDGVLVFLFLGNDIEPRRIEHFSAKESILRRFALPSRLGKEELMESLAYPTDDLLESRSHLFVLIKSRLWPLLMRLSLSARRFPEVLLRAEASSGRWQVTAELCAEIAAVAGEYGTPIRFVLLPSVHEVDEEIARIYARSVGVPWREVDLDQPREQLSSALAERGIQVIDLVPLLREVRARRGPVHGSYDTHFNRLGHQVVADRLLDELVEMLSPP